MSQYRYQQHRQRAAARQRAIAAAGKDLGDIPPIADLRRYMAGLQGLRQFCEAYLSDVFNRPWSRDHLTVIDAIERAVCHGALLAIAMPRGFGKSSLLRAAALWAILTGRRRYVVIVAANSGKAIEELDTIKTIIDTNDDLAADYPEAIYPFRALEGTTQRQRGQTFRGRHTHIRWLASRIVVATIPGSPASGAVISAAGLESGNLRGQNHQLPDGRNVRPDLVLIDDPQTRDSALSPSQTARRLQILNGDVLGMAGPGRRIAGLLACTIIAKYDLADRILDRKQYPEWHGTQTQLIKSWPTNQKLWDQYAAIRRAELANDGDGSKATAFYLANRAAMDQGADVAWPDNFTPPDASALQAAINLRLRDEEAFWAEYQNQPIDADADDETIAITPARIRAQIAKYPPCTPQENAAALTAFIDVQQRALYWLVCSWGPDFTGRVIDWGTWPDQPTPYHSYRTITRTLARAIPGESFEARLRTAMTRLTEQLFDPARYESHHIDLALVDANWGESTAILYDFCRYAKHPILPSHGRWISATARPMTEWRTKGRAGLHWRMPPAKARQPRRVLYDSNWWKSFIAERIRTAAGRPGALTFPSKKYIDLLIDHLTAEKPVKVSARDRTIHEWKLPPSKPDNHWLDCLVGCAVAANIKGISPPASGAAAKPDTTAAAEQRRTRAARRRRVSYL